MWRFKPFNFTCVFTVWACVSHILKPCNHSNSTAFYLLYDQVKFLKYSECNITVSPRALLEIWSFRRIILCFLSFMWPYRETQFKSNKICDTKGYKTKRCIYFTYTQIIYFLMKNLSFYKEKLYFSTKYIIKDIYFIYLNIPVLSMLNGWTIDNNLHFWIVKILFSPYLIVITLKQL